MEEAGFWEDSLDLHGYEREEAVLELDIWLNQAFLQDLRLVRIICGWGAGILLKRIEEELARHPLVESHRIEGSAFIVWIIPRSNDGY